VPEAPPPTIAVSDLRLGLYVYLDLGWMDHPFPLNRFKISTQEQIDTIRSLGLQSLRYAPELSDAHALPGAAAPEVGPTDQTAAATPVSPALAAAPAPPAPVGATTPQSNSTLSDPWKKSCSHCERQHAQTSRAVKAVFAQLQSNPASAGTASKQLVQNLLDEMLGQEESALRLLADTSSDHRAQHALNVSVLCLLLGRALQLPEADLHTLGLAGLLHDIGKFDLPTLVRYRDPDLSAAHLKVYQEHVGHSLAWGKRMGLTEPVLQTISQHHEYADGSGFPQGLRAEQIGAAGGILALVNHYDSLCNPHNPLRAVTPHEALSILFAKHKAQHDHRTLSAFIRMMGIYPPGSVVQLSDERYAVVVSVNAARPLKPEVMVYERQTDNPDVVHLLDLQQEPQLSIARSLRPQHLPRPVLLCLSPKPRYCYFFERALSPAERPAEPE